MLGKFKLTEEKIMLRQYITFKNVIVVTILIFLFIQQGKWKQEAEQTEKQLQQVEAECQALKESSGNSIGLSNQQSQEEAEEKSTSYEEQLKEDTEAFLRVFYEYDEKANRAEKVREFATDSFIENYFAYSELSGGTNESGISYRSEIEKLEIYVQEVSEGRGKVFARVWNSMRISDQVITQVMLEIEMVKEGGKYIANDISIQGEYLADGFID